jgi:hypothetical protein
MSRMKELLAAKADGQVVSGIPLGSVIARSPAQEEGARDNTQVSGERQVELG